MYSKVIAVDLAKDVYQVALSNSSGRIFENLRLTRPQFERFVARHEPATFVIEACGSAHHWGRFASSHNHTVRMLPAQFVKPYRLRNKTDKADSEALVDAHRSCRIKSVPVRIPVKLASDSGTKWPLYQLNARALIIALAVATLAMFAPQAIDA